MKTIPGSPSLLLRSTHIFSVRVDAAKASDWQPNPSFGVQRATRIVVTLTKVWKGAARQSTGTPIPLEVAEHATGISRDAKMPGVWSEQNLTPGAPYIAFITGDGDDAALLLNDPACQLLLPPANVEADLQLAWDCAAEKVDVTEMIVRARKAAPRLSDAFPVYLWSGFSREIFENQRAFELAAALLVAPEWSANGRAAMAGSTYAVAGTAPGLTASNAHLLIRAFFRLLGDSVPEQLRQMTAANYLPGLIGLRGGIPRHTSEVFASAPAERETAARAATGELSAWLAAK